MRKLLSLGTMVYTAKSIWWDKLSKEDQNKYINQAKGLFQKHKGTVTDAGKKFADQHKGTLNEVTRKLKEPKGNHSSGTTSEGGTLTNEPPVATPESPMTPNHPRP